MKPSPFCLHRFFATNVVQDVVYQVVAVKVKVNAGFAFTLNRLIYSLLRGEVKGEGKNGKFAECAGAYIRVGACPARRVKGSLCGVGRFEIKQGRKSRKVGTFGEKVGLYFSSGVGESKKPTCLACLCLVCSVISFYFSFLAFLFRHPFLIFLRSGILAYFLRFSSLGGSFVFFSVLVSLFSPLSFLSRSPFSEKYAHTSPDLSISGAKYDFFLFSTSAKVEIGVNSKQKLLVKLIFSA